MLNRHLPGFHCYPRYATILSGRVLRLDPNNHAKKPATWAPDHNIGRNYNNRSAAVHPAGVADSLCHALAGASPSSGAAGGFHAHPTHGERACAGGRIVGPGDSTPVRCHDGAAGQPHATRTHRRASLARCGNGPILTHTYASPTADQHTLARTCRGAYGGLYPRLSGVE